MTKKQGWSEKEKRSLVFLQIRRVVVYIICIFMVILTIMPILMMIINATQDSGFLKQSFSFLPGNSMITNFISATTDPYKPLGTSIINSLIISVSACVLSVYFSTLTAYAIFAYDFKLKKLAFGFILLIMMVPTQVSAVGFIREMRTFGLINSFVPFILPTIAAPATFYFIKQYMESALPKEIIEAGRIDGGHEFYIFNSLALPIIKPAMAVQVIFTFVNTWNNYFLPALLITTKDKKTMPIVIKDMYAVANNNYDLGQIYMALTIAIVPVVIIYLCLSKFIVRGIALGSVKG